MQATKFGFIVFVLLLFLFRTKVTAQSDSLLAPWAEFLEDDPQLIERIQERIDRPLNINRADKNDWLTVPFLSKTQIDSILALRERIGRFKSKRQIRPVVGGSTYRLIRPLITAKKTPAERKLLFIHKTYYPQDVSGQFASYNGNRIYDYNKVYYRFSSQIQAGFISQKDAGEANFFDYWNGFVSLKRPGWSVALGSQFLEFGLGLLFSSPFSSVKSAQATSVFTAGGLKAYAGLTGFEGGNLFGARLLATDVLGWQLLALAAQNQRDGQLSRYTGEVVGLDFDGYHRSEAEIETKGIVRERLFTTAVARQWNGGFYSALLVNHIDYRPPLRHTAVTVGEADLRRTFFRFSGRTIDQTSLYLRWQPNRLTAELEAAHTNPGQTAGSASLFLRTPDFRAGIKWWRVPADFHSPYGRIFDDLSQFPRADQGYYLALAFRPAKRLWVNAYRVFRKDLWRTYFDRLPHSKSEWLVQIDWQNKKWQAVGRVRRKFFQQEANTSPVQTVWGDQWLVRLQLSGSASTALRWKTRWQATGLQPWRERGSYLFQEIQFRPPGYGSLRFRVTFFRTDSYRSRLYEYENDLPGSFANYPLYGEGFKWFVLLKMRFGDSLDLWLKYRYLLRIRSELNETDFRSQPERRREFRLGLRLSV